MQKLVLLLFLVASAPRLSWGQADCSNSIIICGNTTPINPSGVGNTLEQLGCGGIEHNSVWFSFQAKSNGKLNFVIRPTTLAGLPTVVDVDWTLYRLSGAPSAGTCNTKTQLSCNFAGSSTVYGIPGATGMATPNFTSTQFNPGIDVVAGTWYSLMIDQFSNTTPILLSVQFTGNTEFSGLNSTSSIFDARPDFTIGTTNACTGSFSFSNTTSSTNSISSYAWDFGDSDSSTLQNPNHTYTGNGNYFVTLTTTDNTGCASFSRKLVVYNNTPPVINNAGIFSTPSCTNSNNGEITITTAGAANPGVSGGTPPYTYELVSPSATIRPAQASNVFSNLSPGGYFIRVTDACGKSVVNTSAITVAQTATNSLIGLGIQNIQSACVGTPSGTATIFANGTVPPYTMALVTSSPVTTGALPALQRDPITATYFTTFTGLTAGLYTVEAIDGCGKARRATFTVNPSSAPIATTVNSPSCLNSATGTLTVTATGANGLSGAGAPGEYQYALIAPSPIVRSFQTSSVFENLLPGTYTIAVRDVCGNVGISTSTVGTASLPNFGTSFTRSSCPSGSTGILEVQLGTNGGGGTPYQWALIAPSPVLRPNQSSSIFENLPAGTYTVRLSDACGQSSITTVVVPAGAAPSFTTAVTNSCTTASGTVTITPGANAVPPFRFELISPGAAIRPIQGSNVANTFNSIFTGLAVGSYTIRMTDGCGVPVTGSATIGAAAALTFPSGSSAVASCATPGSGQITVATPTTGIGAYRFELIAPSPVIRAQQYSRIFNNLPPGNYVIRITDSCGAQVDNSATPITVGTASAPGLTVTNTASCATASGTITCVANTANQGGGSYQFALIAPSAVTRPNQTSPIFTGLPAGSYTVQITDQCGQTGTTTTTVAAAGAFTPAAGASIASCNGTGYFAQIIVTTPQNFTSGGPIPPGSGGGPYTFAVYDATNTTLLAGPQSSNVFPTITPLAGTPTHTIRVTDVCNNTSTATVSVNPPSALTTATITAITSSCASAATGVIRVTTGGGGGLPPYRYSLIDFATSAVIAGPQTALIFNQVPANSTGYLVRTTDACGNSVTSTTPLLFPASVNPTVTAGVTASCASSATGRIVLTPGTGATLAGGTFSYALYDATNVTLIRSAQALPVFTNVAAGDYTVRISDRCSNVGTVAVNVPGGTALPPTATGTVTGTCSGGSTGVIRAATTLGTQPAQFTLINQVTSSIVAGPQVDSVFSGLSAGTYIVRVTDACGVVTNSSNLVVGDLTTAPTITTSTAIDCAGLALAAGFGNGGSGGPFTYAFCNGSGCTTFGSFSSNGLFTINSSGTYRIAVRDRCGLQTISSDVVITIPSKPVITSISKANNCGTTTITPTVTGVPNTAFFSLNGSIFNAAIPTAPVGCNTIRVSDNNAGVFGCASDPFDFSIFTAPSINVPTVGQVNCNAGNVTVTVSTSGGNLGCGSSGASYGVKLVSCVGCAGTADPIGTIRASGGTFNLRGATSASFAGTIQLGGVEQCAGTPLNVDFAANYCFGGALPIRLEYFRGNRLGNTHQLDWKLHCDQTNVAQLVLERSSNGHQFEAIYTTQATTARCLQPFTYTDANPLRGLNYYRVRMVDDQGVTTLSRIVRLLHEQRGFQVVQVVPNPVPKSAQARVLITSAEADRVQLRIMDVTGRSLATQMVSLIAGENPVPINVNSLMPGTYFIQVESATWGKQTVRLVKD